MRRDMKSFKVHDKDYGNFFDLEKSKKVAQEYEQEGLFEKAGFQEMVEKLKGKIKTHIDIGSGTGWLVTATSPYFERVVGIEPSKKAIDIAKALLIERSIKNIEFLEMDMVDGINHLNLTEPVFITTAIVLSHIRDFYVKEFLRILNHLSKGSVLYFDEPYEENVHQNLWHIRSKEWWAKNLPEWQLDFLDINYGKQKRGIRGRLVGRMNVKEHYSKNLTQSLMWHINGMINKVRAIKRKILSHTR